MSHFLSFLIFSAVIVFDASSILAQEVVADFSPGRDSTNFNHLSVLGQDVLFFAANQEGSYLLQLSNGKLVVQDSSLVQPTATVLSKIYSNDDHVWYFNTSQHTRESADGELIHGMSILKRDLDGTTSLVDTVTFYKAWLGGPLAQGPRSRSFITRSLAGREFYNAGSGMIEILSDEIRLIPNAYTASDFVGKQIPFFTYSFEVLGEIYSVLQGARFSTPNSIPTVGAVRVDSDSVRIVANYGDVVPLEASLIISTDLSIEDPSRCTPALQRFDPLTRSTTTLASFTGTASIFCNASGRIPSISFRSDSVHYYRIQPPSSASIFHYKVDSDSIYQVQESDVPPRFIPYESPRQQFWGETVDLDGWTYGISVDTVASNGIYYTMGRRRSGEDIDVLFRNEIPIDNESPWKNKYLQDVLTDESAIYFMGSTINHDFELWRYKDDVIERMTNLPSDSFPFPLGISDDLLYFEANRPDLGTELWSLDLSAEPVNNEDSNLAAELNDVSVFPNPIAGQQILKILVTSFVKRVKIFDALGRTVQTESVEGVRQLTVDISTLTAGMYFVEVQTDKSSTLRPITVL